VYKAGGQEPAVTAPQFKPQHKLPGQDPKRGKWQGYVAGLFRKKADIPE